MYKNSILLIIVSYFSINCHAQFITVRYKEETLNISDIPEEYIVKRDIEAEQLDSLISLDELKSKISKLEKLTKFSLPLHPTATIKLNSLYGYRIHPIEKKKKFHYGIDISTKRSLVYSILPGIVYRKGYDAKGYGNFVEIKTDTLIVIYAHLSKIQDLKLKQPIEAGDCIGISGSTGNSTGDHLHVGVKYKNNHVDPQPLLHFIYGLYKDVWANDSVLSAQIIATK